MTEEYAKVTDVCPNCGGSILGDGYTQARHCEFAKEDRVMEAEPDAPTILCEEADEIS